MSSSRAPRPLDGLAVTALAADLRERALGLRVDRVRRLGPGHLVLRLKPRQAILVLCAAGRIARVTLVDRSDTPEPKDGGEADAFLGALRRHLTGATLEEVAQPGGERMLTLTFRGRDVLGDLRTWRLHVEMTGRHGNIVLTDATDIVVEADRRVPGHLSRVRRILPGLPYALPPVRPGSVVPGATLPGDSPLPDLPIAEALPALVQGLSRQDARERTAEAGIPPDLPASRLVPDDWLRLGNHLALLRRQAEAGRLVPQGTTQGDWRLGPRTDTPAGPVVEAIMAEAARAMQAEQEQERLRQGHERLIRERRAEADQLRRILEELPDTDSLRREADLILTWVARVDEALERGAESVDLEDPADGTARTVRLDGGPSASAEASRRYATIRKAEGTRRHMLPRLAAAESACRTHDSASTAGTPQEPDRGTEATLPDPRHRGPGLRGRSSDGWLLVAGRSPKESDALLRDWAQPDDWWFHADRFAGGHVFARPPVPGQPLPERTLTEAATWAACRSSGREDTRVNVLVTQRRHLRKAKGLPPGKVLHRNARTVRVTPDPEIVSRLRTGTPHPDAP